MQNTQPKFVVSRNYFDLNAKSKWISRPMDETPRADTVVYHHSIVVNNVTFAPSSSIEEGFGCSMVANTPSEVEVFDGNLPKTAKKLRFVWNAFSLVKTGKVIHQVEKLYLLDNGSMYADGEIQ